MRKNIIITASVIGALSVAIGAFGAHSLKAYLEGIGRFDTFETAVRYQFYHTIALLLVGILMPVEGSKWLRASAWCYGVGMIFFCGSLYALCATNVSWWGAVAPIGGLLFIAGWLLLAIGAAKLKL